MKSSLFVHVLVAVLFCASRFFVDVVLFADTRRNAPTGEVWTKRTHRSWQQASSSGSGSSEHWTTVEVVSRSGSTRSPPPPPSINSVTSVSTGEDQTKEDVDDDELCIFLSGEVFRDGRVGRGFLTLTERLEDSFISTEQKQAVDTLKENVIRPLEKALNAKAVLLMDTNMGRMQPGNAEARDSSDSARTAFEKLVNQTYALLETWYAPYRLRKAVFRRWDRDWSALLNKTMETFFDAAETPRMHSRWVTVETKKPEDSSGTVRHEEFVSGDYENDDQFKRELDKERALSRAERVRHVFPVLNGFVEGPWWLDLVEYALAHGLLPYYYDPTRAWLRDFGDSVSACGKGLLTVRPDMVVRDGLRRAIETANVVSNHGVGGAWTPGQSLDSAHSPQRWSFAESREIPIDFSKILWLASEGPWIANNLLGKKRLRMMDGFTWLPPWVVQRWRSEKPHAGFGGMGSAPLSEKVFPRVRLFRNHLALGYFPAEESWYRARVGMVSLNQMYGSNSAAAWNPFFRVASRLPVKGYDQLINAPSAEFEGQISDVAVGALVPPPAG